MKGFLSCGWGFGPGRSRAPRDRTGRREAALGWVRRYLVLRLGGVMLAFVVQTPVQDILAIVIFVAMTVPMPRSATIIIT